jgi:type II secretory pathway component PulF
MASFNFLAQMSFKRELPDFFKNLALMAESGIPLNESIHVLSSQARSYWFRTFLTSIQKQVEQGSSLSRALTPHRELVGDLVLNVIRAGEINGTLEKNFQYIADLLDRRRELRQKIGSALLYPEIVLAMVFIIGGGIATFVLPKLIPLFQALNVELPLATRVLLGTSVFLQHYGLFVLVGILAGVVSLVALGRVAAVRWAYDSIALRIPFFGPLVKDYQLALFSQIFGTLFQSGLAIREALTATAQAMTNARYRHALEGATRRLTTGVPLAQILGKVPEYFPQNMVALITVGESSGKLEESFAYLAKFYDREVDMRTKRLPTVLEPILLFLIGMVVIFVAMAIILPIYEISTGIQPRQQNLR